MTDVERAAEHSPKATRGCVVDAVVIALSAVLIFTRLGVYPFWGDEADTVIYARSIWETGDMHPWYGENLYAYRDGAQFTNRKNRSAPPLPYYVTAPFWGFAGDSRFWLRFPFGLCGVGVVALMQYGWRRLGFSPGLRLLLGTALACNTSLVLYSRQCRYYALAALLSVAFVMLYLAYEGSRRRLAALVTVGSLLIATHFMNFAAVTAAVLFDYMVWHRRRRKLSGREWLGLLVPLGLVFCVTTWVYFPLRDDLYPIPEEHSYWLDRLTLLWWSLRDCNFCEYGVGLLGAAAGVLGFVVGKRRGDWTLLRLFAGSAVFLLTTVFLLPQPVAWTNEADVRYLMPLIIPGTALGVLVLWMLVGRRALWAAPLVAVTVLSNVLHQPHDFSQWRSTIYEYVQELRTPRRPASAVIAEWLNANVAPGSWVAVSPTEWMPPQIILSPHLRYGWQIEKPKRPEDFADLDPHWHLHREPVEVFVVHGFNDLRSSVEEKVLPKLAAAGQHYEFAAKLDAFFDDRTRPELFWHWFREQAYDNEKHAVYVYRRVPPAVP